MISPAMIAALIFGAFGLLAGAAVQFILGSFADEVGVNRWIFIAVPGLFAMLFAMVLFQDARRKVKKMGESVSRGILIALLTWIAFALLATMVGCPAREMGQCFSHLLIASGFIGGGPMLAAALLAGLVTGMLIIRPPRKALEE
jgi:MFS family permease